MSFRFPLKDYASKLTDLRSPVGAPLANFKSRRSTPLFGLSADPRPISPTRAASPNAPFHSRLRKFPSEPVDARQSCFMPTLAPGMNHASRAASRYSQAIIPATPKLELFSSPVRYAFSASRPPRACFHRGPGAVPEGDLRWPPGSAGFFG